MVDKNMFGFKASTTPAEFVMWSDMESSQSLISCQKAAPPTPRDHPSLANCGDVIFVIAGYNLATRTN